MILPRPGTNLNGIAESLGVSVATVSNALSGKGRVSSELADKIRLRASELGYVPSQAGRALRTGRSRVFGLVLPDIANPLFPKIAQAIEAAAAAIGYGVLIADSRGDLNAQTEAINRLLERDVDGMIIVPRRGTRIADIGCPVAVIDSPSTPGNTVSADHWQAGQQIAAHLSNLGHRRFLLIGTNPASNVQNDRIGGIKSALQTGCVSETLWIERLEQLHGLGCQLGLAEKARQGFTAFAAVSDLQALRALTELQQAGIAVPMQASVTGFDDLIWSQVVTPALTTMRMDMHTIAEIAVSALMRAMDRRSRIEAPKLTLASDGHFVRSEMQRVPMELIVRQSSGSPQSGKPDTTEGEQTR